MDSPALLPAPFWFRFSARAPYFAQLPNLRGDRLCPLPVSARLPIFSTFDGSEAHWELRVGWNPAGLGLALEVLDGRDPFLPDPDYPEMSDGLEICIDTRDTRDVHRATRYCHRFIARVSKESKQGELIVSVEQRKIHRALEDAKIEKPTKVESKAGRLKGGWWLDLFFPASSLAGYDPETNSRLGFNYVLHDPAKGDRFFTVGRDFPISEDPSLWSTLELVGAEAKPQATSPKRKQRNTKARATEE
jgi:hypothetical protein